MTDKAIGSTVSRNHTDKHTTPAESLAQLQTAVQESHEVLMQATSFGLFPDTITLDRSQITVTKRLFLRMATVDGLRIEDILNVTVTVGPIFGTVKFFSRTANIKPCEINYLWRADAIRLKRIAQGYVIAIQREIDCSTFTTEALIKQLEELDQSDEHN